MSRDLKFRAWRKKLGGMFYLDKHGDMNTNDEQINLTNLLEQLDEMDGALGLEWMQYTGLSDRKGKEIYEGDIVKRGNTVFLVVWHEYGWHYAWKVEEISSRMHESDKFQVIGNIYSDKELLNEQV